VAARILRAASPLMGTQGPRRAGTSATWARAKELSRFQRMKKIKAKLALLVQNGRAPPRLHGFRFRHPA